jgi:DNA mismatch repair protein MutL
VGLKQEGDFISGNTDFSFESEEVTGLFNEEGVEQTVNNAYQIHKNTLFLYQIRNGYCGSAAGTSRVLYEQF